MLHFHWFFFHFNDSVFGVGTLSSIFKPPLPDSLSESVLVVHSWISDNEQLTIRWHKRTKNNWNDKIYGSNSTEGPDDEFRCGRPLMLSEDKDFLKKNLLQLKKKSLSKDVTQHSNNASKGKRSTTSKPNTTTSSSAAIATKSKPLSLNQTAREDDDHTKKTRSRRHLDFYQAESAACIGGKENDEDQTSSTSLEKDDSARIKRRLEQENDELKKKVARLENEKEEERKILNGQITELEIQLNTLEDVCKEKTNEVSGLNDTLEKMHSDQLLPTVLIQHITGLIDVIKADSEKRQAELSRLQSMKLTTVPASAVSTPCSSPHATPSKRLVKLYGDVFIDRDALKNAVAYGSTANTDHNLNLMINTILDAFFTQSQLAGYSLSGKACPNMKGSKPKPKIPSNIIQALKSTFLIQNPFYSTI
ncbi:hypothetical protein GHT06_020239 [Daphnia sinensis]|uniref:BEN domain-containing protein n=1 Tax=Daphnia sinensis TaxID=1820382 RepID=A0AAD5PPB2_9CRUS|nr:hypothetical protein GHT06_020239 [Daphnia sinensis]